MSMDMGKALQPYVVRWLDEQFTERMLVQVSGEPYVFDRKVVTWPGGYWAYIAQEICQGIQYTGRVRDPDRTSEAVTAGLTTQDIDIVEGTEEFQLLAL